MSLETYADEKTAETVRETTSVLRARVIAVGAAITERMEQAELAVAVREDKALGTVEANLRSLEEQLSRLTERMELLKRRGAAPLRRR